MKNQSILVSALVSAVLAHGTAADLAMGRGLTVKLPDKQPCDHAVILKIKSQGIVPGA